MRRFKVRAEILWAEFLVSARLRAVRALSVIYAHHVTSESRDTRIYARVVLPTQATSIVERTASLGEGVSTEVGSFAGVPASSGC